MTIKEFEIVKDAVANGRKKLEYALPESQPDNVIHTGLQKQSNPPTTISTLQSNTE